MKVFKLLHTYILKGEIVLIQKNHSKKYQNFTIICIIFIIIFSPLHQGFVHSKPTRSLLESNYAKLHKEIEIPAGTDYYVKINRESLSFDESKIDTITHSFSDKINAAIVKSPTWLQRDLIRQFNYLSNKECYADLLINASIEITDEIAFSIAYSPLGNVATPAVLLQNALWLYELDKEIDYANIIDYYLEDGDYYSTVEYKILRNNEDTLFQLPMMYYYWYIVHPELAGEGASTIYETFWREFLYRHNDINYPLLKEKIQNISYLWDEESYYEPSNRIWTEWIEKHPTGVEAVSYWVGKTVSFLATGDRPNQPNLIAHQHNGYCGELQRLAIAAQRTVLMPTRGIFNIGEDHVWREFFHQGWHQNDNWWADTGGCVDIPYVYTDGWGKDMSAIYAIKGDGSISDVTKNYLHAKDCIQVDFQVYDAYLQPYDGALITVLVKGIKDVTWYKNTIIEFLENTWNKLPIWMKGNIMNNVFQNIIIKIEEIPETIDGTTVSIWNYTDIKGHCSFTLGKNDEYIFLIQDSSKYSWPLSIRNTIRLMSSTHEKSYKVFFADFSMKPLQYTSKESNGDLAISLSYNSSWFQIQKNIKTNDIGIYHYSEDIEVFFVDESNFQKYKNGKIFETLRTNHNAENKSSLSVNNDVYLILSNRAHQSHTIVDYMLEISKPMDSDFMHFTEPKSSIFKNPSYNVGDQIKIHGFSSDEFKLEIRNKEVLFPNGSWHFLWNTTGLQPGSYIINATSKNYSDQMLIDLYDVTPPDLQIISPVNEKIIDIASQSLIIEGSCYDASGISHIEVAIDDGNYLQANGTNKWMYSINPIALSIGIHNISIKAIDFYNNAKFAKMTIIIIDDAYEILPEISNSYHTIQKLGNWSKIIIYANVTTSNQFPIKTVDVHIENESMNYHKKMFLYGAYPILNRHQEDFYQNQSNTPRFGCELGDFYIGSTLEYWIVATDMAGNSVSSSKTKIII
jgi:Big-like domain-containing protein